MGGGQPSLEITYFFFGLRVLAWYRRCFLAVLFLVVSFFWLCGCRVVFWQSARVGLLRYPWFAVLSFALDGLLLLLGFCFFGFFCDCVWLAPFGV